LFEVRDAVAGQRRDHEGRVEPRLRADLLREREQRGFVGEIDLVQHKHFRLTHFGEL